MRRREFIMLIGATAGLPLAVRAEDAGRTYRLGVLWPFPRNAPEAGLLADELRRHGFIEGQNLTIEYRAWVSHVDLISEYAAELVNARVDAISAGGDLGIRAAQHATKTIPVLGVTDDMVGAELVASMARPNGSTTGIRILAPELDGKRQEILIEALPGLHRIAAIADSNTTSVAQLEALQEATRARGVEISIHRITRGDEIASAIDTANAAGAGALNVLASPMLTINRQIVMDRVAALRLPAIYQWPETAEAGGFAAYGPRFNQIIRQLATRQLVQIFHGAKVAEIPVEQPTKFVLVINLKTAKALGVTVPESLLVRADQVIE